MIELGDDTVAEVLRESELCLTNIIRRLEAGGGDDKKAQERLSGRFSGILARTYSKITAAVNDNLGPEIDKNLENVFADSEYGDKSYGFSLTANISQSQRPYNQRIDLNLDDDENGRTRYRYRWMYVY